jgi:hypothetical protein
MTIMNKPRAGTPIEFVLTQGATGRSGVHFGVRFIGGFGHLDPSTIRDNNTENVVRALGAYHAALPVHEVEAMSEDEQRELLQGKTLAEVRARSHGARAAREELPQRLAAQDPDVEVDGVPPPPKPSVGKGNMSDPKGKPPGK